MALRVKKPSTDVKTNLYIELLKGLWMTLKTMFTRKSATIDYPYEKRIVYPRFRGKHALTVYEDGRLRCVACFCCAKACPTKCIRITPSDYNDEIEKGPAEYEIDLMRCAFCGLCVEACPCAAIIMTDDYDYSAYNREDMVLNIEKLRIDKRW